MHKTARIVQFVFIAIVAGVSCNEATSPKTIEPPADVTAPRVTAISPTATSAVPRATTFRVTFSEAMAQSTINASTFLVRASSGPEIAGIITYEATTTSAEFVPATILPNASGIVVTITTGVRDQAGNPMAAEFGVTFSIRDEVAPSVSTVTPADFATDVSTATSPEIQFSEAMDAKTINSSSVTLRLTSAATAISGSVSYDAASRTAVFRPVASLDPGSSYTIGVSTAVKDSSGNALTQAVVSSFVTAAAVTPPSAPTEPPSAPPSSPAPPEPAGPVDNTRPVIVSKSPSSGATGVSTNATIEVGFSEAMDANTINDKTFLLFSGATPIGGRVTYESETRIATFTPNAPLIAGQTYGASIMTGVKDLAGNPPEGNEMFSFTVAASQPAGNAFVWVMVVDRSGLCITGATVRVLLGQRAGETVTMKTPCDAWDYDGGYFFEHLTAGEEMTLQASAPGYEAREMKVSPSPGPQFALEFVLSRK